MALESLVDEGASQRSAVSTAGTDDRNAERLLLATLRWATTQRRLPVRSTSAPSSASGNRKASWRVRFPYGNASDQQLRRHQIHDRLPDWSTCFRAGGCGFESHRRDLRKHSAVAQWQSTVTSLIQQPRRSFHTHRHRKHTRLPVRSTWFSRFDSRPARSKTIRAGSLATTSSSANTRSDCRCGVHPPNATLHSRLRRIIF